jgi:hypothetical protein
LPGEGSLPIPASRAHAAPPARDNDCFFPYTVSLPGLKRERFRSDQTEVEFVSIIRVGLAETKNFSEGYEAIFGKKKKGAAKKRVSVKGKAASKKKPRKKK